MQYDGIYPFFVPLAEGEYPALAYGIDTRTYTPAALYEGPGMLMGGAYGGPPIRYLGKITFDELSHKTGKRITQENVQMLLQK